MSKSRSRTRIRTIKKMGDGQYFTKSQTLTHYGCMTVFILPFKLIWLMFKYTVGLPFVIASRTSKKNK